MSNCAECDCPVSVEDKGYSLDDEIVHRRCVKNADRACTECWLVHNGICG